MQKNAFIYFFSIVILLLSSCATNSTSKEMLLQKKLKKATAAVSVDELQGKWYADDQTEDEYQKGYIEYPVVSDGKRYILFHYPMSDNTSLWKTYAANKHISFNELWSIRYAESALIYNEKTLVLSTEDGIQTGRRFLLHEGIVYSGYETLVPERLLAENLNCFLLAQDTSFFVMNNTFHLFNDSIADINLTGTVFYRRQANEE